MSSQDLGKRSAALAAAERVQDGMLVGLGTGSTVAFLLQALADRHCTATYVCTSPRTEALAVQLGLQVRAFDELPRLDLAIDGADEVAPDFWLVKGGGAAHTREKLVAAAADRFLVIVDSSKVVNAIRGPIPLELMAFGLAGTLARLGDVTLRAVPPSPDGGVIADYHGPVGDPAELAIRLSTTPGVVDHGLFGPWLVSEVVVGDVVVGDVVDGDRGRAYWLERTSSASTNPPTQGAPR